MSQKSKTASAQPALIVDGEVVRRIRQHARSSPKTEVCGILIGQDRKGLIEVQACIDGVNAEEAGAHVTFTQDTWEHIYKVKDKQYPDHRIVGWYHSHPGFGVFLSDHDTFIHKNFFASPGQVAWVFDPHSDEEGCFGWVNSRIERLSQVSVSDRRGGELAGESGKAEPVTSLTFDDEPELRSRPIEVRAIADNNGPGDEVSSLTRLVSNLFSYLTVFLLGFLVAWYFFPRVAVMGVPIDPQTGQPLNGALIQPAPQNGDPARQQDGRSGRTSDPHSNGSKGDNVGSK
jgi:proteasome lid subunit RPN8/RPN11